MREKFPLFVYFYTEVTEFSAAPPSSVSLNLCRGPLGRDVQVGGFVILVTHVASLLVVFNPITVLLVLEEEKEMGWAKATRLTGAIEGDDDE